MLPLDCVINLNNNRDICFLYSFRMTSNRWGYLYEKSFHLHRMNNHDDLNLYYGKFLNKLSKICLKIFLPLLSLLYLFALFLCRFFLSNQNEFTFDLRTILFLVGILLTFVLLFLVRLHTKWKTLWFCTRLFLVFLLLVPLILTYQTEQYHLLLDHLHHLDLFVVYLYIDSIVDSFVHDFRRTSHPSPQSESDDSLAKCRVLLLACLPSGDQCRRSVDLRSFDQTYSTTFSCVRGASLREEQIQRRLQEVEHHSRLLPANAAIRWPSVETLAWIQHQVSGVRESRRFRLSEIQNGREGRYLQIFI